MMNEVIKMQLEESNNVNGGLTGYNCDICKNKGVIYKSDDSDTIYAEECECMTIRNTLKNAKNSGLGNYINKTLADFKTAEEWQKGIYNKAVEYLNDSSNAWFIITGQSGAGKTLISSIIANNFLFNQRKTVYYLTWTDFIGTVKRNLMSDKAIESNRAIERAKSVEILFIDELLKNYTDADKRYITEIINYRYSKQLKTIITSELSADELFDIDEATFGRMIEMSEKGKYYKHISKDRSKNQRLKI